MITRPIIASALSLALLAQVAMPCRAYAQEPSTAQRATAESLFADGKRLMAAGKIDEACNAFAESQRLDAGGGTLFALAFCHEQAHRTASAWLEFKEALAVARRDGRRDREVLALEHIRALEPQVAHLTIRVAARAPELTVILDGAPIVDAAWGSEIPIDPGAHVVEARAPGKKAWSTTITFAAEAEGRTVDVPRLDDVASAVPAVAEMPRAIDGHGGQHIAGAIVGVAGIAFIGVGVGFGARAAVLKNRSDASCDRTTCDASGLADYSASQTAARAANIGVGAGLVALGVGVVLFLTGRKTNDAPLKPSAAIAADFVPLIGPGQNGFALTGRF